MNEKIEIKPIIDQINSLGSIKRFELNQPTLSFFNDPWKVKQELLDTPLGNLLQSLGDIGQARLLNLASGETYTAHYDPDDRIHLAITTNPYSYLVDLTEQKMYHIPVDGRLWYMDTGKLHIASNWGPNDRIHLNIRVLLPKLDWNKPHVKFYINSTTYDWKQQSYLSLMGFINKKIKEGSITGFHSVNEREVYLNADLKLFDTVLDELTQKNIDFLFESYNHVSRI